jgi:hypothetical protein
MDGEDRVPLVVTAGEHLPELEFPESLLQRVQSGRGLIERLSTFFLSEFDEGREVVTFGTELGQGLRPRSDRIQLVEHLLRGAGVGPEVRRRGGGLELYLTLALCGDVKDTPRALRSS